MQHPVCIRISSHSLISVASPLDRSASNCKHLNVCLIIHMSGVKIMALPSYLRVSILLPVLVLSICSSLVNASTFNVQNKCSQTLTVCDQSQVTAINCYVLGNGASRLRDVGSNWPGGLFWGFPDSSGSTALGNQAKPQANLVEVTVTSPQDSYDLSNVNAWNLPVLINPTQISGDPARSGQFCGTPICQEGSVSSFCQSPNTQTGYPGYGCYNVDGPNVNSPTTGTQMFKNNCQSSYSYSTDNTNTVFACPTNSAYEIVFCP